MPLKRKSPAREDRLVAAQALAVSVQSGGRDRTVKNKAVGAV
jgi:hypothetical protein